MKKIFK
ncbi:hypothetical protein CP8484711_0532A, partial [Chlamydia psittaci 84-8471/1]